jgi:hypothetical protein
MTASPAVARSRFRQGCSTIYTYRDLTCFTLDRNFIVTYLQVALHPCSASVDMNGAGRLARGKNMPSDEGFLYLKWIYRDRKLITSLSQADVTFMKSRCRPGRILTIRRVRFWPKEQVGSTRCPPSEKSSLLRSDQNQGPVSKGHCQ